MCSRVNLYLQNISSKLITNPYTTYPLIVWYNFFLSLLNAQAIAATSLSLSATCCNLFVRKTVLTIYVVSDRESPKPDFKVLIVVQRRTNGCWQKINLP